MDVLFLCIRVLYDRHHTVAALVDQPRCARVFGAFPRTAPQIKLNKALAAMLTIACVSVRLTSKPVTAPENLLTELVSG